MVCAVEDIRHFTHIMSFVRMKIFPFYAGILINRGVSESCKKKVHLRMSSHNLVNSIIGWNYIIF